MRGGRSRKGENLHGIRDARVDGNEVNFSGQIQHRLPCFEEQEQSPVELSPSTVSGWKELSSLADELRKPQTTLARKERRSWQNSCAHTRCRQASSLPN